MWKFMKNKFCFWQNTFQVFRPRALLILISTFSSFVRCESRHSYAEKCSIMWRSIEDKNVCLLFFNETLRNIKLNKNDVWKRDISKTVTLKTSIRQDGVVSLGNFLRLIINIEETDIAYETENNYSEIIVNCFDNFCFLLIKNSIEVPIIFLI